MLQGIGSNAKVLRQLVYFGHWYDNRPQSCDIRHADGNLVRSSDNCAASGPHLKIEEVKSDD
jgi:hypothetical protein